MAIAHVVPATPVCIAIKHATLASSVQVVNSCVTVPMATILVAIQFLENVYANQNGEV